ncbi:MAG: type II secretion system protein GspE [Zetaproteobacteria bacterium CG_4_9_14_3_um_filter_49_83]|nr:MAG: type II secretion system protein GspE [Zetaproteobacteria bacterium CG1_02_49_23]PIQ30693.1 MAG: type II secretion system protein GspE [Zetaproteobacteria bacterium CG17_big_fil_post_rev_8_21_14_2_50_50_13]PIV29174.1 MAG: type II secretion system protein GspE [Zetaproteobacteria bacterium CG02_land_8_20_14_3_00_50_9]PIY57184.1 MAG: type II secretion system protein GspE [Zetaproteobacteria bacterium CG_4_10_14_0_8_um_filter_49_80]PJA34459.1 MAG: type II secretion system protein GspE [Zet
MLELSRLTSDLIDAERTLLFSLPVLRQGPIVPLKPMQGLDNPVAIASDAGKLLPWSLLDDCRRIFGCDVQLVKVPGEAILMALNQVFDMSSASAEQMLEDLSDTDDWQRELEDVGDLLESEDDAPVIRLVNTLVSQAMKDRASDIHIEPFETEVLVRFRIDGVLHSIVHPPKGVQAAMASRIKVMAGLDIAEKRHPQDGRFRVKIGGREIDVRVSILPTAFGERVVMRLLDRSSKMLTLQELGMSHDQFEKMQQVVQSPHGIVLVTGPTGSGKSTTLYASLMEVDRSNRNVMTIEDPIEYQVTGVGQMQVQPKIGLTFAAGLRSILRQDPDIVMIGEIRDLETAEIAIQASLTGHLVFATLHTNDALSSINRLQDMGVEPYLIASSLVMVQAQRLVRRLCPHCKAAKVPDAKDFEVLEVTADVFAGVTEIYEAVGCDQCMQTGFIGRIAIYEIATVSDNLRNAIHEGKGLLQMRKISRREGMKTLRGDGARHVARGITTVDEVLRVTRSDVEAIEA